MIHTSFYIVAFKASICFDCLRFTGVIAIVFILLLCNWRHNTILRSFIELYISNTTFSVFHDIFCKVVRKRILSISTYSYFRIQLYPHANLHYAHFNLLLLYTSANHHANFLSTLYKVSIYHFSYVFTSMCLTVISVKRSRVRRLNCHAWQSTTWRHWRTSHVSCTRVSRDCQWPGTESARAKRTAPGVENRRRVRVSWRLRPNNGVTVREFPTV